MRAFDRQRIARLTVRASYFVFAGFLLMMPLVLVASGLSGGESSMAAALVMYIFALGWQAITVFFNFRRVFPWVMLIGYIAVVAIPLIGSLLSK